MAKRYYNYRNIDARQAIFTALFVLLVLLIIIYVIRRVNESAQPAFATSDSQIAVIIDAGHGGEDGGAVGYDNNTCEKGINLAVAQKLKQFLTIGGFRVIMTREKDQLLNDEGLNTVRQRKVSDIQNRMQIIEKNPDAIFISIHQNKFTQASANGTQIFYSPNNSDSEDLAQSMQDSFRELIQPANSRQVKKAGKEIYLLYHSKIPSIMVECGFLSNKDECEKLLKDEYQSQVAFSVYAGLMKYIDKSKKGLE